MATALMKPTSTAVGMNRTSEPSLANPSPNMIRPVSSARVASAAPACSPPWVCGMSEMTTDMAPVAWTVMKADPVAREPPMVPSRYP